AAPGSGARSQRWQREVIGRDGKTFGQNGQEIVCIPLAGQLPAAEPIDTAGPALKAIASVAALMDEQEDQIKNRATMILNWKPPAGQATVTYPLDDGRGERWLPETVLANFRAAVLRGA